MADGWRHVRPMSHLQLLSRNFIARQNRKCDMAFRASLLTVAQLLIRLEQRSLFCETLSLKCGER